MPARKAPGPCRLHPKHKWTFVRNVTRSSTTPNTARLWLRGFYRCECGATKYSDCR